MLRLRDTIIRVLLSKVVIILQEMVLVLPKGSLSVEIKIFKNKRTYRATLLPSLIVHSNTRHLNLSSITLTTWCQFSKVGFILPRIHIFLYPRTI